MSQQQRKSGPKAGDATGRQKAAQEAEQQRVAEERQSELTMINQQVAVETLNAVFDPSNGSKISDDDEGAEAPVASSAEALQVIDFGVETAEIGEVVIRVNETLTNVTIGAGNYYNFDEGKKYKVPVNVAAHLEEKGYLWH